MSDRVPARIRQLDTRRAWARCGAPLWFLGGVVVIAVCNASLVVLALAAWVRLQSWWSGDVWRDSSVWRWLPGGVVVMAALAVAISIVYLVLHGISAAPGRVLAATGAVPADRQAYAQLHNVAEELSIGLGATPPELFVTPESAPNALSAHGFRRKLIVATTGATMLPRAELEALLAHEMGHLHAVDARWVTAASVSLGHANSYANMLVVLGGLVGLVFIAGLAYADAILVSWLLVAIALVVVGTSSSVLISSAKHRVRRNADDVADVVAVKLAKHPEALGELLYRLEHESSVIRHSNWRTAMLWFEEMAPVTEGTAAEPPDDPRRVAELRRRCDAAYATANVLPPPRVA